jgi:hypothetical protein
MTKSETKQADSPLAITSMVLGVVSLTGPGFILGIPAIILAIIALAKKQGGKGLSITGLVTGSISTLASILFIAFFVFIVFWTYDSGTYIPPASDGFYSQQL